MACAWDGISTCCTLRANHSGVNVQEVTWYQNCWRCWTGSADVWGPGMCSSGNIISAQQGGSEGQHRQLMLLQRSWPFAQRSRGGAKWLQPGFCPLSGHRQQRGLFPLKPSWFLHKRLQESLKNGTGSLELKVPPLWDTRSCLTTNERILSLNQTAVVNILLFSFHAVNLCYMGQISDWCKVLHHKAYRYERNLWAVEQTRVMSGTCRTTQAPGWRLFPVLWIIC